MSAPHLESLHDLEPGTTFIDSDGCVATVADPECFAEVNVTHYFVHESGTPGSMSTDTEDMVQVLRRPRPAGTDPVELPSLAHLLAIANVAMTFGEVERTTMHPDGRFESDTTHTVMLALVSAECASVLGLQPMLAVAYAMVHDLPETYAKDTCTAWGLSAEQKADKARREALATEKLRQKFGHGSKVMEWLDIYEQQRAPEARLVRYLDKVLPKLTHVLNEGAALEHIGMSPKDAGAKHTKQNAELANEYPEFSETIGEILDRSGRAAVNALGARSLMGAVAGAALDRQPPHPSLRATSGYPCEKCESEDGNTLVEGWYRCNKCGHPAK